MVTREQTFDLKDRLTVSNMVDYAGQTLHGAGYYPYYMYRQSKSLGNLENVGWCKPGYDCLYNVYMMDETHTVLAVGAGAVTKLRGQNSGMIERIYNYKYPYEYIRDFDTLLERKKRIPAFMRNMIKQTVEIDIVGGLYSAILQNLCNLYCNSLPSVI